MTLWDEMKNHWYIYETIAPVPENSRSVVMGRGLEVVRCKECKFLMTENEKNGIFYADDRVVICKGLGENGFCSKGEFSPQTVKKDIR